jgi:hypothetical protein
MTARPAIDIKGDQFLLTPLVFALAEGVEEELVVVWASAKILAVSAEVNWEVPKRLTQ